VQAYTAETGSRTTGFCFFESEKIFTMIGPTPKTKMNFVLNKSSSLGLFKLSMYGMYMGDSHT